MNLKKINFWGKDISRTVSKTYKVATEKSGKLIEEAKLRLQIASINDNITEKLEEIGALVYEDYKSGESAYGAFEDLCKEVEEAENTVSDMKKKILEMKKMKQCVLCENPLDKEDKYCPKCGAEQPSIVEESEEIEVEEKPLTICPNCNLKLSKDDVFCSGCGIKLTEEN